MMVKTPYLYRTLEETIKEDSDDRKPVTLSWDAVKGHSWTNYAVYDVNERNYPTISLGRDWNPNRRLTGMACNTPWARLEEEKNSYVARNIS